MKKLMLFLLVLPLFAWAQNPFDGTWKVDASSAKIAAKPDVYVLQNGMYDCKSCVPPYKIKADGTDQKVSGHPYFDTIAIKAVDDKHVEESWSKNGKKQGSQTYEVSPDGKTMTVSFTDNSAPSGQTVTGKGEMTRVAAGPAGAHAMSGSWEQKSFSANDEAMTFTIQMSGDSITVSSPTGTGYTAKLDGTEAPYKGDPGITSVTVKKLGPNTLEETDKRDGKVIGTSKMTVNGNKMTIDGVDKLHGAKTTIMANKT